MSINYTTHIIFRCAVRTYFIISLLYKIRFILSGTREEQRLYGEEEQPLDLLLMAGRKKEVNHSVYHHMLYRYYS